MKIRKVFSTLAIVFLVLGCLSVNAQTVRSFTGGQEWANKVGATQTPTSKAMFLANKYGAVSSRL